FLNGDLDEEVYMKQPEGFVMPGNEHKVCKLVKSLYGLKQAPKQWHQKFDEVVLSSGFHLNQSDKCVYSKFDNSGKGVIICLYVDDMLIFGTDQNQVDKTKKFLSSRFSMKDMGEADIILGIKIKRENKGIVITQSHYIEKILKKFNREDCSPVSTPMDPVEKLKPNTGKPVDQLEYSRAIGCLMYAMTSTRPDIAYAVGRLSRFTSNPSRQHWKAITRVFKYLRGTKDYGLSYVGYPSVLEGYSDASWINHVEDSSSTSGWVFLLGGGAISWASKKQTCITSSTMESEFVALAAAGKEAEWLRNLIHEIPIWPKPIAPISIRCDSAPTMARAYSQIYNGKSRHLGVRHSMVRELIRNGVISIEFVRTQHNLADHLTKGLARDLLEIGTQVSSSRGARSKGTTYVNMKFSRFKKLGLSFLYVHQWIGTHGLAVVRLTDPKRKTLGEKGIDCIFVGYAEHSKAYSVEEDPRTYNEAMQSRDIAFWKEAINDEIGSIMENNTWVLSDLPPGFRQKKGIDYFDTYAPVALITTIRLLLALAAIHNLVIHQINVKTSFLNGDLEEEVYMKQPKGFVMPGNEHKMCAMTSTRPDIAYAVGKLSRFTSNPSRHHWKAITRVFKYLRDSSSTSGRVFLLGGGAISWASKKKTCITGSTMKSEFVALTVIGSNIWLENLFMLKL
ncbi:zinc finger, CCHC-type containing protein, partial [Tanacetum coccineum]